MLVSGSPPSTAFLTPLHQQHYFRSIVNKHFFFLHPISHCCTALLVSHTYELLVCSCRVTAIASLMLVLMLMIPCSSSSYLISTYTRPQPRWVNTTTNCPPARPRDSRWERRRLLPSTQTSVNIAIPLLALNHQCLVSDHPLCLYRSK